MVISSADIKKELINSILDFSVNIDTYKQSGDYSINQISEMLGLAIEINNIINALDKDISRMNLAPGLVKPQAEAGEIRKIKRVLELFFKYKSDLNSISIDIGENLSNTNRYLQRGVDYIFDNLSRKDYRQTLPKVNNTVNPKPSKAVQTSTRRTVQPRKKSKSIGLIAPLMFLVLVVIIGMSIYNFFFNKTENVAALVREYRSDRKLSEGAKPTKVTKLRVYGTNAVLNILRDNENNFRNQYPDVNLEIEGGDSGEAINLLIDGKVGLAASSRIPSADERKKAIKLKNPIADHKIALDSVVVFVHKSNPVTVLSVDDLKKIYGQEVINWAEASKQNPSKAEVVRFSLSKQSGTFAFFKDRVMFSESVSSKIVHVYDPIQMLQMISANPNAIGFSSLSAFLETHGANVKIVKISSELNATGSKPLADDGSIDIDLIRRGEYPLTRYLYFVSAGQITDDAAKVIDFMRSEEAQAKLNAYGLVGVY